MVAWRAPQRGFSGSAAYWPRAHAGWRQYGDVRVRCAGETAGPTGSVLRQLDVEVDSSSPGGSCSLGDAESSLGDAKSCRRVTHVHFTGWPNYGVPDVAAFCAMVREVCCLQETAAAAAGSPGDAAAQGTLSPPSAPPLLVHCSGGVGRSGAFVAVHSVWAVARANAEPPAATPAGIQLVPVVAAMRNQRHPWCVETFEQYAFCYDALLHLLGGTMAIS